MHLTDSLPVIMAWKRMLVGKFSTSPRISTLLSTLASLPVRLQHSPGSNLMLSESMSDHASRNPPGPCVDKCEICTFNRSEADTLDRVFSLTEEGESSELLKDPSSTPYLQMKTWANEQKNCPIHCKLRHLISTGQEPEKKRTGGINTTIKHLHQMFLKDNLKVNKSDVIMVRQKNGFFQGYTISVPEKVFFGLAFMLHSKLSHPKKTQLTRFLSRYYYTPALASIVEKITSSCLHCLSTTSLPKPLLSQSTTVPTVLGTSFAADILERNGQFVFACKDEFSQFTVTGLAESQTTPHMRQVIITSTAPYISMQGATLRVDNAPAFRSIEANQDNDPDLQALKLRIETSRAKNKNGNPVAENCIAEIKKEILNLANHNDLLTPATLAMVTRNLNNRVRSNGKSGLEMLTLRDTLSGQEKPVSDIKVSEEISTRREKQHLYDTRHKAKSRVEVDKASYSIGDIVMMREVGNLDKRRESYMVVNYNDKMVEIRKLGAKMMLETYNVDPDQIIKIFDSSNGETPAIIGKRGAAIRSRKKTHKLAKDKVISIKNKNNKKSNDKGWVDMFYQIQQPLPQAPAHIDDSSEASDQEINQLPTDKGSLVSADMSDADHDLAFLDRSEDSLLRQLTPWTPDTSVSSHGDVFEEEGQISQSSLDWDNSPELCLAPVGDRLHSTEIATPALEQLPENQTSPISPYHFPGRITRSLVRSGNFDIELPQSDHQIRVAHVAIASQSSAEL